VARYHARAKRHDNDQLVERLQEIARKKRRRGYRLARRQLRKEGWAVNHIRDAAKTPPAPQARASAVEVGEFVSSCP